MKNLCTMVLCVLTAPLLHAQTGNVGIGTTTPNGKLEVVQSASGAHAGIFSMTNTSGFGSAVFGQSAGSSGSAIFGQSTGGAVAGLFQLSSNTSSANALQVNQFGLGRAGQFDVINTASNTDAFLAQTNGMGAAVRGYTTGIGNAGEFQVYNTASSAAAVRAYNNGSGGVVEGYSLGTGRAAYFQIAGATNSAHALEVTTFGTGSAGKFVSNNPSTFSNALEVTTNGGGYAGAFFGPVYMKSNSSTAGTYALRTYNSSFAPLTNVNNNGNLEVSGFTQHGTGAPAIKTMKLTGTTSSAQGGSVSITHGLDPAKILSVDVHVEYVTANWVPPSYTIFTGYEFSYIVGGPNIIVYNQSGSSASILSKPVKIFITYEQ